MRPLPCTFSERQSPASAGAEGMPTPRAHDTIIKRWRRVLAGRGEVMLVSFG